MVDSEVKQQYCTQMKMSNCLTFYNPVFNYMLLGNVKAAILKQDIIKWT